MTQSNSSGTSSRATGVRRAKRRWYASFSLYEFGFGVNKILVGLFSGCVESDGGGLVGLEGVGKGGAEGAGG